VLESIDRFDGTITPGGPRVFLFGEHRYALTQRWICDGSVELALRTDDGSEELLSGRDMAELATRVNRAARENGIPASVFTMNPDGTYTVDGSRSGVFPGGDLIRDHQLWVFRVANDDRTVPERVRGAWRITARSLDGPAYRIGLRVGDYISEIDGKRPESPDELRRLLKTGKAVRVLRLTPCGSELPLR
jgi:hypothetical protein